MNDPMKKLPIVIALSAAAVALTTGCSSVNQNGKQRSSMLLGALVYEEGRYSPNDPMSITLKTSDFSFNRNVSGSEARLFWGLLTFSDF
jgi:hypothetical protein